MVFAGAIAVFFLHAQPAPSRGEGQGRPEPPRQTEAEPPSKPQRLHLKGIENLYRLEPRLYSGGQPEGDDGFSALRALGIRTIITVDGARPDLEAARRM